MPSRRINGAESMATTTLPDIEREALRAEVQDCGSVSNASKPPSVRSPAATVRGWHGCCP
jgi:hypothetical protein